MNPIAWLVTDDAGLQKPWVTTSQPHAFAYESDIGFTVTPLVAAPPAQTVAEVEALLDGYACGKAFEWERGTDPEPEKTAAAKSRLLALLCGTALLGGAPSVEELADALRDVLNSEGMGFITRAESRNRGRALLSRLPQQEGTDR